MNTLPPYRHESDTSRQAAESLTTAHKYREALMEFLERSGAHGCTIDEFAAYMSVPPNAVSGRFSELEKVNKICKTPMRRKTRSGKAAVVYLKGRWLDHIDMKQTLSGPPPESQIVKYKAQQAAHGHGHVIPRNDGRKEGCGGPSICRICKQVKSYFDAMKEKENV